MRRSPIWSTMLLFVRWIVCLHSERLDTVDPIIRRSPAASLNSGDFFSYAIVLHQVDLPTLGNFTESLALSRIIVGAPKGTFPGGLNYPDLGLPAVNDTGLVYLCSILNSTCEGLLGAGTGWDRRMFDEDPNTNGSALMQSQDVTIEEKEHQFMGASMESTGDTFIVCAPLWANTFNHLYGKPDYRPQGRCYYSPRNLTGFQGIQTCSGGSVTSNDGDSQCTAGISVTLLNGSFIIGAPGNTAGAGVLYYSPSLARYNNELERSRNGETFLDSVSSSTFTVGPGITQSVYLGYILTTGNILSMTRKHVITTYRQFTNASYYEMLKFNDIEDPYLDINTPLMGESPSEFFGYSVATADLNGDGWDEIIVGAPLYSTSSLLEIGRIYVFSNQDGIFVANASVIITGTVVAGRFGHAIVNLGDVNGDSCDDIAVSAPYASTNGTTSSSGKVYIFLGSNTSLLDPNPLQVLDADDVMRANGLHELRSFGYSLASGVDVDGNLYNDLAVGALFSQTVVLFRTLSIAQVNAFIIAPVDVSIIVQNCSGYSCFKVDVCASYTGRGLSGPLDLNLEVREQQNRLFFGSPANKTNAYMGRFQFQEADKPYCHSVDSYIEGLSAGTTSLPFIVQAFFSPLSHNPTVSHSLLDLRKYPEINVIGTTTAQVAIRKNCYNATLCRPDLDIVKNRVVYRTDSGTRPDLVADVVRNIDVEIKCTNDGDDAFGSALTAKFPSNLDQPTVSGLPNCSTCWSCSSLDNTTKSCRYEAFLLRSNESISITLTWGLTVPLIGNETFNISVDVSVLNDIRKINNEVIIPFAATAISDVSVELTMYPNSLLYSTTANSSLTETHSLSDLGTESSKLTVSFLNKGPSTIQNMQVDIYYPYQSAETGSLFYLYAGTVSNETLSRGILVNCSGYNPKGLSVSGKERRFVQRSISLTQWWLDQASSVLITKRNVAPLVALRSVDCSDVSQRTQYCGHISCSVRNFLAPADKTNKNLYINLNLYVDDRYLASKKGNYTFVVSAQATIQDSFVQDAASISGKILSATLALSPSPVPQINTPTASIPWYYIVVPAILGLLFIIIIGCILYFCGFLRRKRLVPPTDEDQPQPPTNGVANGVGAAEQPNAQPSVLEESKATEAEDDSSKKSDTPGACESEI